MNIASGRRARFRSALGAALGIVVGVSLTAGLLVTSPAQAQESAQELVVQSAAESAAGSSDTQDDQAREENPKSQRPVKPKAEEKAPVKDLPVPQPPGELPPAVDALPVYQGQGICSPGAKPGTQKFATVIGATYGALATNIWIPRDCDQGGRSEHKEGRALDWMINRRDKEQRQTAEAFLEWLLATDENGNEFAMARRLGVMYIGWDDRIWESYRQGWSELKGCYSTPETGYDTYCHRDHIHISLSWDGAAGQTSFWGGNPNPAPFCDRWATASATALAVGNGLDYVAIKPRRVLDTRSGLGLASGTPCRITQSSAGGAGAPVVLDVDSLPKSLGDSVRAVVVRTASIGSNSPAQLRTRTGGGVAIAPITVNGKTTTNTIVPVGADGTIGFTTDSGSTHLLVDVVGYLVKPAAAIGLGGRLSTTNPSVVYDTGDDSALGAGEKRVITLTQPLGSSGAASAAVAAITVSGGQKSGRVIIRSDGEKRTAATPVLSYRRNDTLTETVFIPLGDERSFTIINSGRGTVDVSIRLQAQAVVDLDQGHHLVPVTPTQITGNVTSVRRKLREAKGSAAVVIQIDARTSAAAAGVSFWSGTQPVAPSLQLGRKSTQSSLIVVPLNESGQIRRTLTGGPVDLTARIVAYLR
ncbi:MAG: hypothetical protein WAO41_09795 [Candidatus Nanopelagicales bacterium]